MSVKDILSGVHDSELDLIVQAIKSRKEQLNTITFFELKVGDKVRFNSSTRPQYLVGCEAIIKEKKQKKIVVDIINPPVGSRFTRNVRTSLNLVEKV